MASHVLRCPVSFFDSVPRGRILNRFAVDMDSIDTRMYISGKLTVQNSFLAISKLAVVGTQSPVVLVAGAVSILLLTITLRQALRASHTARFRESFHTSRLLSHVTGTMDSLSSIRGYGVLDRFCRHFCRLVDETMRGFAGFAVCYRLVRLATSFCGFTVILCTMVLVILVAPDVASLDPSAVGLALSAASSSDIEPDAKRQSFSELTAGDLEWPSGGKVEFDCYAASYKPGILPDVLKGVSFTVRPTEKVRMPNI
ncbi:unnamed protein product [Ixodes hexagonus]